MKIVSLCPSITETLFALGAGDDVVAVTRYCTHPRERLRSVTRAGGTKNPDLSAIRALAPDLVLMNAEENRREDIERIGEEFRVDVSFPRRVEEIPGHLRHLGQLCGRAAAAETMARNVERALADEVAKTRTPFSYIYFVWKEPWMIAGPGTYIASVCALAGGQPPESVPGTPDYPVVTVDGVTAARPDVILLPDEPYRFGEDHRRFWSEHCPDALSLLVPGDDFSWHGVRTLRGMDASRRLALDVLDFRAGKRGEPVPARLEGRHQRDAGGAARPEG